MLQSFKLAMKSIWSNKMRSFLTMLGIIIGVASVIILVSLVNAYMSYMTDSFASMGTNQITVNMINLSSRSVSDEEMYEFYTEQGDVFDEISPMVSIGGTIKHGNDSMTSTSITGVSEAYLSIKDWELECGRNLQYGDLTGRHKVCVIGSYVADELYGSAENAYGETLKINGHAFTIVGVAARQEEDMDEGGTDDFVWMPYTRAVKMARNSNINNYVFTVSDLSQATEAKSRIESFLYEKFKNEDLYTVTAMSEMLDELNSMIAMVSAGLGGIAGISLLVAGVGVMNIMLVSVTERTREIGIRKALGARTKDILTQFLIEAAMISAAGGLIGTFLGISVVALGGMLFGITTVVKLQVIVIAVAFSAMVGLGFGLYPARKAAKADPVIALRYE